MNPSFDGEFVKQQLQFIYQGQDIQRQQSSAFFQTIIQSPDQSATLFNILLEIAIKEENLDLKKVSIIVIKHFDYSCLENAVKILNQELNPIYYSSIEILTDTLATKFRDETYELVTKLLSIPLNDLVLKTVLQIIHSLFETNQNYHKDKENQNMMEPIFPIIFEYMKTYTALPSLDLNHFIIIHYFFQTCKPFFIDQQAYELVHNLTCLCLSQRQFPIPETILDTILDAYAFITHTSSGKLPIDQFFGIFDSYCKAANIIPSKILDIGSYIILHETSSLTFSFFESLIIEYIFPQLKINPDHLANDHEAFIDMYQPDFSNSLPISILYSNLQNCYPNENISTLVYSFSMAYCQQNQTNPIEIATIMNFLVRFLHSSRVKINFEYKMQFCQTVVFPLMETVSQVPFEQPLENHHEVIGIAISNFLEDAIDSLNQKKKVKILETHEVCDGIIIFLRRLAFDQTNDSLSHLVFYFAIKAIRKLITIVDFQFSDDEAFQLYSKTYEVANEFPTTSIWNSMSIIIQHALKLNQAILGSVIEKTWESFLMSRESGEDLFDILKLLQGIFDSYSEQEDHDDQVLFDTFVLIFGLLNEELEGEFGSDMIVNYYDHLFEIIESFVSTITNDENVLEMMSTIVPVIFHILSVLIENKTISKINEEFDDSVFALSEIVFVFLSHISDAEQCLTCLIEPFIFPLMDMINAILECGERQEFTFECLNAPLIKYCHEPQILEFYMKSHEKFCQMQAFKGQNELLASLIIASPALYFESIEAFLQSSRNIAVVIYEFAVLRILQYCQEASIDPSNIQLLIDQFVELAHDEDNPLIEYDDKDNPLIGNSHPKFTDEDWVYYQHKLFPLPYYEELNGELQPNFLTEIFSIIATLFPQ